MKLSPRPKISFFNDKYGNFFHKIMKKLDDKLRGLQLTPFKEIKRNTKQKNVIFFTGDQK
ncbi:MAG: hypothetical protein QJQ54_03320 [Mollicutes bacterium]|nr:MAG: hypothetical protein QJQ54_03320 [Mollicutes bacterium]